MWARVMGALYSVFRTIPAILITTFLLVIRSIGNHIRCNATAPDLLRDDPTATRGGHPERVQCSFVIAVHFCTNNLGLFC